MTQLKNLSILSFLGEPLIEPNRVSRYYQSAIVVYRKQFVVTFVYLIDGFEDFLVLEGFWFF